MVALFTSLVCQYKRKALRLFLFGYKKPIGMVAIIVYGSKELSYWAVIMIACVSWWLVYVPIQRRVLGNGQNEIQIWRCCWLRWHLMDMQWQPLWQLFLALWTNFWISQISCPEFSRSAKAFSPLFLSIQDLPALSIYMDFSWNMASRFFALLWSWRSPVTSASGAFWCTGFWWTFEWLIGFGFF